MTQKSVVLAMLREAGPKGVSVHELVYRRGITRAAALVYELRHDDGYDIDTEEGKLLPDGRTGLARYIMRNSRKTEPPKPPVGIFDEAEPAVAKPLGLPCGCLRSADGRSWLKRCPGHAGGER